MGSKKGTLRGVRPLVSIAAGIAAARAGFPFPKPVSLLYLGRKKPLERLHVFDAPNSLARVQIARGHDAAGHLACWAGRCPIHRHTPTSQFELADTVQLDQADNAVLAQLERVNALLADRQWDEAVEILRQVSESSEGKLLGVTSRRFVGLARLVPASIGRAAVRGIETLPRPRRFGSRRVVRARDCPTQPPSCCKMSSSKRSPAVTATRR